jgi:hypothetical protein
MRDRREGTADRMSEGCGRKLLTMDAIRLSHLSKHCIPSYCL